ncbi:MAG TPA: DsrE/DsrF/DrsH-like family protein [Dehalococcoidia bacterium]|nr:DsrE/DsrF/DrsH-like family protein [Dehalococcoidia bacterium]
MAEKESVTLVVFSGELDKALAAFNIAIGAASMGMEVSMFFTFWGLNIIKRNEGSIKSRGIMRKMLNRMNRGGAKRLPLSKFQMLGLGKWMIGRLMRDIKSPPLEEMMAMAKGMGVKFIACTTSMGMMGIGKEAFIPDVDSFAGVATYLAEAKEGNVNLFI